MQGLHSNSAHVGPRVPSLCSECISYALGLGTHTFWFGLGLTICCLDFQKGSYPSNHLPKRRNETQLNATELLCNTCFLAGPTALGSKSSRDIRKPTLKGAT